MYNLYALNAVSSIPEDQKNVLASIVKVLGLPSNQKNQELIYDKLSPFFQKNWSAHWTTNSTGADSKIKDSKTQICDVTIYNDNRVVNSTFVYFKKEKQLFVTVKEYVEVESSTALKLYNEIKADPKFAVQNETDNYAYFNQKGYMSYQTYHIKSPVGMVVYEGSYFLDVVE